MVLKGIWNPRNVTRWNRSFTLTQQSAIFLLQPRIDGISIMRSLSGKFSKKMEKNQLLLPLSKPISTKFLSNHCNAFNAGNLEKGSAGAILTRVLSQVDFADSILYIRFEIGYSESLREPSR
jgi:hypothetical protein